MDTKSLVSKLDQENFNLIQRNLISSGNRHLRARPPHELGARKSFNHWTALSRRRGSAMLSPPRGRSSTTRLFSSAEDFRCVKRRSSFTIFSGGCFTRPDFCLILAP
jgi:hypothetical protein